MEYSYKIIKHLATLAEYPNKIKELNIISHNNSDPKYDIRIWDKDGKMGKGVTLDDKEWEALCDYIGCDISDESDDTDYIEILDDIDWLSEVNYGRYEILTEELGIGFECDTRLDYDEDEETMTYSIVFQADESKTLRYVSTLNAMNKLFSEKSISGNAYVDYHDDKAYITISGSIHLHGGNVEEELEELEEFFSESAEFINEIGDPGSKLLRFEDFIVIGDKLSCVHADHKTEELIIGVNFRRMNNTIIRVEGRATYCADCNLYFMRKFDYHRMRADAGKADMLCQEIEEERYVKNPKFRDFVLNDESILRRLGYYVSGDMTDSERQRILAWIVDNQILTKENVAWRLAEYIKSRSYDPIKFHKAIAKWTRDREFILDYQVDTRKKIDAKSITIIKYKRNNEEERKL